MNRQVDPDFQRRIDEWNAAHPGPADIAIAWHPVKNRWQVFAMPVADSSHPLARHEHTSMLMMNLPDSSGRRGILLNTWQGAGGEFLPLDERLFEALHYADSFRSKDHFEETITNPDKAKEIATSKKAADLIHAAREYWWKLDSLTINMNPANRQRAGWRDAQKGLR